MFGQGVMLGMSLFCSRWVHGVDMIVDWVRRRFDVVSLGLASTSIDIFLKMFIDSELFFLFVITC